MMTTASLFSFLSKPGLIISSVRGLFSGCSIRQADVLGSIELPLRVSLVGVPVFGLLAVRNGLTFSLELDISWDCIAIPLTFLFTVIAVNSTGLTSITPVGALGKLTQLNFSVLAPGKPHHQYHDRGYHRQRWHQTPATCSWTSSRAICWAASPDIRQQAMYWGFLRGRSLLYQSSMSYSMGISPLWLPSAFPCLQPRYGPRCQGADKRLWIPSP